MKYQYLHVPHYLYINGINKKSKHIKTNMINDDKYLNSITFLIIIFITVIFMQNWSNVNIYTNEIYRFNSFLSIKMVLIYSIIAKCQLKFCSTNYLSLSNK